jgi:predicted nuclease of predicted toxin-antitoxin system
MKYFVDANLPFKLASLLKNKGFDVLHTDDMPNKERTTDNEILKFSEKDDRIVITKDSDFLDSHLIKELPSKLLYIATGNISNKDLIILIEKHFPKIVEMFSLYNLIELSNEEIIIHEN